MSPACPDLAVDLKPTNDKALEGTVGDGMKLWLVSRSIAMPGRGLRRAIKRRPPLV